MATASYFSLENLRRATALGLVVTALAWPRLQLTGRGQPAIVGITFLGMILVAGAVTAWGARAGMPGFWPGRRRGLAGMGAGLTLGLAVGLLFSQLDLPLRGALSDAEHARVLALAFPADTPSRVASILWAAGLETLFFEAGATSFFARLTDTRGVAVAASALLRGAVAFEQARGRHIDPALMVFGHLGLAAAGSFLFAWAGLPAASLFAAAVSSRVFW